MSDTGATDIPPGNMVTPGTWTDTWPVQPGQQHWTARFTPPLALVSVRCV